jgi:membrane-bound ClpP family serine protease
MMLKAFDKVINIRKLAALDLALNGWTFISTEFFVGVFGLMTVGILLLIFGIALGFYIFLTSFNYIPLFIYILQMGNQKNAKKEARVELSKLKKYGPKGIRNYNIQQLIVFIPFSIVILSLLQEIQKI